MRNVNVVVLFVDISLSLISRAQPGPDMAALRKTIDDYNVASQEAMMTNDVEKAMSYYADDAIQMPPNSPANRGKEAIRAWINGMMQSGMKVTAAKFTSTEVDAGGKVAYEVGDYDMTMTIPEMGEMKDNGKYVAVWKQQQDGSWKVHAEIWNTNVPMQMPGEQKPDSKDADKK